MGKNVLGFTIQIVLLTIVIASIWLGIIIFVCGDISTDVVVGIGIWSYGISCIFHLVVFFKNELPPLHIILKHKKEHRR